MTAVYDSHHITSRHALTRARQHAVFEDLCNKSLYVIRARGSDGCCGCPCCCCTGSSVKCEFNRNFLPDELNNVMSMVDYTKMIDEIDAALKATHLAMIPCIFTHLCLPFSPFCAMYYWRDQRYKRIQAIVEKFNIPLQEKGYYWQAAPRSKIIMGFAFLRVNRTAADNYTQTYGGVVPATAVAYESGMDRYAGASPHYEMATVVSSSPSAPVKTEY